MKLLEAKDITQKEIDYINKLIAEGMTLKKIVQRELDKDATAAEVEGNFQMLNTFIKSSNYAFNREKKIYEFKKKIPKKKKIDEDDLRKQEFDKTQSLSVQKKSNQNPELNKDDKKNIRKKPTKSNPLAISSAVDIVKIICENAGKKEDRTPTGVYIMNPIAEDFSILEDELYYLPGYALIDAALIISSCYIDTLEKSNAFKSFTQIVREQKNNSSARKKQINVKLSDKSTKAIGELSHHFPFLNKSEIINFSMYALSQSSQISFIKKKDNENEKQHTECIN